MSTLPINQQELEYTISRYQIVMRDTSRVRWSGDIPNRVLQIYYKYYPQRDYRKPEILQAFLQDRSLLDTISFDAKYKADEKLLSELEEGHLERIPYLFRKEAELPTYTEATRPPPPPYTPPLDPDPYRSEVHFFNG